MSAVKYRLWVCDDLTGVFGAATSTLLVFDAKTWNEFDADIYLRMSPGTIFFLVPEFDYRELLKRYIQHVGVCEGTDFLGDYRQEQWDDSPEFQPEEWDALNAVSVEAWAAYESRSPHKGESADKEIGSWFETRVGGSSGTVEKTAVGPAVEHVSERVEGGRDVPKADL